MAECALQIPKVEGLPDGVITVGRKFILDCQGEFPKTFKPEAWPIEFAENQNPHSLKILSSNFISPEKLQLEVTSYLAGNQQFQPLKFKLGEEKVDLGKVNFEVQSVIEKQEAQVEPFGPMVLAMSWPLTLWLSLGLIVVVIATAIGLRLRTYIQRKNLIEDLRKHDSALSPLAEVHKLYRHWRREKSFFYDEESSAEILSEFQKEVDQAFRLFLTRTFKVPALKWTDRKILKDVKKYHPQTFESQGFELKKLMLEMAKASEAKNLKSRDGVQLAENFRVLAERISKAQDADLQKGRLR